MSEQELFDAIYLHVVTQGEPSIMHGDDGHIRCRYRTSTGLRCAIGGIMPDAAYSGTLEGKSASAFPAFAELPPNVHTDHGVTPAFIEWVKQTLNTKKNVIVADKLQCAHDFAAKRPTADFVSEFKSMAAEVAQELGLVVPQ